MTRTYTVETLAEGLRLVDAVAALGEAGTTELARALGIHKNRAFRLAQTCVEGGYLVLAGNGQAVKYRLGPAAARNAEAALRNEVTLAKAMLLETLKRLDQLTEQPLMALQGEPPR